MIASLCLEDAFNDYLLVFQIIQLNNRFYQEKKCTLL